MADDTLMLGRRARMVHPGPPRLSNGLELNVPDEPWVDDAVCAQTDPDVFFPESGESSRPAKSVCEVCPVEAECLAYALGRDDFGVWGGLSRVERRRLKREMAA